MSVAAGAPVERCTALILAGSRGPGDLVAAAAGVSHKALVPVGGVPMLLRVVHALQASQPVGRILISGDTPALLGALPALRALADNGAVECVAAATSPSLSVLSVLERRPAPLPLLVTTADHALLTPAIVEHFWGASRGADVAAAVARAETIRHAYPAAARTYLRFRDGAVSGCNLFAFRTPRSAEAARFWRRLEHHRKRPLRMIALLGPVAILGFLTGRLSLAGAARRLSRKLGVTAAIVDMPFADAAIDVDKAADLALAEAILATRQR